MASDSCCQSTAAHNPHQGAHTGTLINLFFPPHEPRPSSSGTRNPGALPSKQKGQSMINEEHVPIYFVVGGLIWGTLLTVTYMVNLATPVPNNAWLTVFSIPILISIWFLLLSGIHLVHSIYLPFKDKRTPQPVQSSIHPSYGQRKTLKLVGWSLITLTLVTIAHSAYQHITEQKTRSHP